MNTRQQRRATPSRASVAARKARPEAVSEFDRVHRSIDGYLDKASAARKRLLEEPYDPKSLHAWRVNLRRITATLKRVARLSDDDLDDVLTYLRTCRDTTGQCRDIDILADETLPTFIKENSAKSSDAAIVQQAMAQEQQRAHAETIAALKKTSLSTPIRSWRHWAESLEPPTDGLIRSTASAVIDARYSELKKRASKLDGGQKRLHRLRTATKKLRYSIDLYQHAFTDQASAAWLKQLADLQAHLGLAHDRMMARRLFAKIPLADGHDALVKPFRRWAKLTAYDASKKASESLAKLEKLHHYWRA
jgi:CHAD domain-containing protein